MKVRSYRDAGVDIDEGDAFARFIGSIDSPAVSKSIGGFSGATELDLSLYKQPVLLSTTDGVGTKLLVAKQLGRYDTIGIDLVAMCVNDLIICGARPVSFLDYIACGKIDRNVLGEVIKGIVAGCEEAGCRLTGGETAEMPDMYGEGDIDLAGFCTGIVEKEKMLPQKGEIRAGAPLFGLPSTGIHSNGLSLARKVFSPRDRKAYEQLLVPTKIYVRELNELFGAGGIQAAAHITGGGLEGNIARVLPGGLSTVLSWDWERPEIFRRIQKEGGIDEEEMRKVFNLGIGIVLVISPDSAEKVLERARNKKIPMIKIGEVTDG